MLFGSISLHMPTLKWKWIPLDDPGEGLNRYPLYQKGNPQLRVFLPNFWMKIIRPQKKGPPNIVYFGCSVEMTKYDVKNYLEKIYKIPVVDVHMFIKMGKFRRALGASYVVKDDDLNVAKITLPLGEKFEFPNLFPEDVLKKHEEAVEDMKELKDNWNKNQEKVKHRPGIPTWFNF